MPDVVVFKPGKAFRDARAPKRKPRKKTPVSSSKDPRVAVANRTFEVTRCYALAENIMERRIRIRVVGKGGLEDEVYLCGGRQCYVGLVSEQLTGRDKWSPYTWGHVPVEGTDWVREIVNEEPPRMAHKKDEPADG